MGLTSHQSRISKRRTLPAKLRLDSRGLVEGVRYVASPNCDERPAGCAIGLAYLVR